MLTHPVLLIRGTGNERDAQALGNLGIPTVSESFTQILSGNADVAWNLLTLLRDLQGWVIITSRNAIDYWSSLVSPQSLAKALTSNTGLKFAAIGAGSADALRSHGVSEILIPEMPSSAGLVAILSEYPVSSAILPVGDLARGTLPAELRNLGWTVKTGVTYINSLVTIPPAVLAAVERGEFSGVLLRSPSAVRAFAHFVPNSKIPVICGGTTASQEAQELALNVVAIASDPSPEAIAKLIAQTLEE